MMHFFLQAPIEFERQSPVHCCWCPLGSITATLHLQHRGFVPGQNILINAEIHNSSNTAVIHTKVILCQVGSAHQHFYSNIFFSFHSIRWVSGCYFDSLGGKVLWTDCNCVMVNFPIAYFEAHPREKSPGFGMCLSWLLAGMCGCIVGVLVEMNSVITLFKNYYYTITKFFWDMMENHKNNFL